MQRDFYNKILRKWLWQASMGRLDAGGERQKKSRLQVVKQAAFCDVIYYSKACFIILRLINKCVRAAQTSSVECGVVGVFLDELAAWCHIFAHEHGEHMVGLGSVANIHLLEATVLRVHCGFLELLGVHLTKTFESLNLDFAVVATAILVFELLHLHVGPAVFLRGALAAAVERRCGYVEESVFNHLRQAAIEERHEQSGDVGTIDIGIGHDDDAVVAQLVDVEILGVVDTNGAEYVDH